MRYAVKFAYDGLKFFGYQRQPKLKTVEGEIIKRMKETHIIQNIEESGFQGASRTDKGVSAVGSVIAFNTDFREQEILGALNGVQDIWFYALAVVANDFNPRFAKQRWYRYLLPSEDLDIEMIRKASKLFIGEHDFSNFSKSDERNRIRRIDDIKIKRTEDFFIIDVYGESFLWHMVRKIMSALQKVGKGEVEINRIKDALHGKSFDFGTAPPEPLFLMDTKYDFSFRIDKNILRKFRKVIDKKWLGFRVREEYFSQLLSLMREQ